MMRSLSKAIDGLLAKSPIQSLFRRRGWGALTVLAYHEISDASRFASQMEYVRKRLHPVAVDDVVDAMTLGACLPERATLVTFDDGHRSVLETALPILSERSIPAVVYVVAGLLDTDEPSWWDEVEALVRTGGVTEQVRKGLGPAEVVRVLKRVSNDRRLEAIEQLRRSASGSAPRTPQLRRDELPELEAHGITVGNHTLTHPCLHQCDEATIQYELETSQRILTEALGYAPRTLAYPNGDHDPRVRQAVEAVGFEAAFLFDHRLSPSPPADPLRISRLRVNSDTPMDRFKIILSGLHPAIHHARGRA